MKKVPTFEMKESDFGGHLIITRFFYKKFGSGHSTKSFLIGFLFFECMNCQCGR